MGLTVTNRGVWKRDTSGRKTTEWERALGDQGTVKVTYENVNYTFGPGQSITFSDVGIATAVAAQDARLAVADTREGFASTARS